MHIQPENSNVVHVQNTLQLVKHAIQQVGSRTKQNNLLEMNSGSNPGTEKAMFWVVWGGEGKDVCAEGVLAEVGGGGGKRVGGKVVVGPGEVGRGCGGMEASTREHCCLRLLSLPIALACFSGSPSPLSTYNLKQDDC